MYLSFNVNNHHTNYSCPWYNSNGRESYVLQPTTTTDNTEAAVFSIIVCYSNENTQFFKVVLACYDNAGASARAILCSKMSS
jgi:hypothetical protein